MAGGDRLRELEEKYEGYKVYDKDGQSIGKVDDLFIDDGDREEYIGVKMGLFGLSGMTLIPMEIARVNEGDRVIEVSESKERVKDAPHYSDDDEIDGSFEERIRSHFGLTGGSASASSYGRPTDATGAEGAASGDNTVRGGDMDASGAQSREPVAREQYRNDENYVSDSAMGAAAGGAATGGMSDLETGEGRGQQGEGSSSQTSSDEAASQYFGAPVAKPGEKEFEDMQDYQSASTGFQPDRSGASSVASGEGAKPEDFAGAPVGEPGSEEFRAFEEMQESDAVGSHGAIGEPGRPRIWRLTQRGQ